jgi:hypothetical protein
MDGFRLGSNAPGDIAIDTSATQENIVFKYRAALMLKPFDVAITINQAQQQIVMRMMCTSFMRQGFGLVLMPGGAIIRMQQIAEQFWVSQKRLRRIAADGFAGRRDVFEALLGAEPVFPVR